MVELSGQFKVLSKDVLAEESVAKKVICKLVFTRGLPNWEVFSVLFQFIKGDLMIQHSSMSPYKQLLLVLMRFRLSFSGQDPA